MLSVGSDIPRLHVYGFKTCTLISFTLLTLCWTQAPLCPAGRRLHDANGWEWNPTPRSVPRKPSSLPLLCPFLLFSPPLSWPLRSVPLLLDDHTHSDTKTCVVELLLTSLRAPALSQLVNWFWLLLLLYFFLSFVSVLKKTLSLTFEPIYILCCVIYLFFCYFNVWCGLLASEWTVYTRLTPWFSQHWCKILPQLLWLRNLISLSAYRYRHLVTPLIPINFLHH